MTAQAPPRRWFEGRHLLRIALGVLLAIALVVAWRAGLADAFSAEALQARAAAAGPWGLPLFLVLFALGELLHVPAVVFLLVAGLLWPAPLAVAAGWVGATAGATLVFTVSRYVLGDWVRARTPARVAWMDERLGDHGIRNVAIVRIFTFMAPLMHWVLGVSRVSFVDFVVGTAIGVFPGVVIVVLLGEQMTAGWEVARPWVLGAGAAFALYRLGPRVYRWATGASAPDAAPVAVAEPTRDGAVRAED